MKLTSTSITAFSAMALATASHAAITVSTLETAVTTDFTGYGADGLVPAPSGTQFDSDNIAVRGLSDSPSFSFGDTETSDDFTGALDADGLAGAGLYAADLGGGNTAFAVQATTGDFNPGSIWIQYSNATGVQINSATVGASVYVRNDQDRSSTFNFGYATTAFGAVTPIQSYTSTEANIGSGIQMSLAYASSSGFNVTVPASGSFFLVFESEDVGGSGSRDEFAIDDLSVSFSTARFVPEPATTGLLAIAGLVITGLRGRKFAA